MDNMNVETKYIQQKSVLKSSHLSFKTQSKAIFFNYYKTEKTV